MNTGVSNELKEEVQAIQRSWGEGVVWIGAAKDWAESHERAGQFVARHYDVESGELLFCPTKAAKRQFRGTLRDAVSYFVGGDEGHDEDSGFALEPWTSVCFENTGVVRRGDTILTMGNYFFQPTSGDAVKVEYTFVYVRDASGRLTIALHHSALPYGP
jgi:hypothetical protein